MTQYEEKPVNTPTEEILTIQEKTNKEFSEKQHKLFTNKNVGSATLQNYKKQINECHKPLLHALEKATKKKDKCSDECDLYGRLLDKKLRQCTEAEREEIMYKINGLLLDRRRRKIPKNPENTYTFSFPFILLTI